MRRLLTLATLIALVAINASAATRLTAYSQTRGVVPVDWPQDRFPIAYQIDRRVAGSVAPATIDRAFSEWTTVPGTEIRFSSQGVVDGAQFGQDGKNSIVMADQLFANQKFIAMTTNWYDGDGRIKESDIQLDGNPSTLGYNMQLLFTHEVGHLLGLDHSAVLSSVMYPYVSRDGTSTLDSDDKVVMATVYPHHSALAGGIMKGQVRNETGGIFAAQVVALNDVGEPVATALTDESGDFVLPNLPAGNYRLYAEPLDGPVNVGNLSGYWQQPKVKPFRTQFLGTTVRVDDGKVLGNLAIDSRSDPVQLNPRWVGMTCETTRSEREPSALPVNVQSGTHVTLTVGGDGFTSGMTTFEVLNPGFQRTSDFRYQGNYVSASYEIRGDAPAGSAVIMVKSGNESAALTGALRVRGAASVPRTRVARR